VALRETNSFDLSCQATVPQAIRCFLEANSWEEAVRNAVYIGSDSDTIAAMAGAVAEAWFGGIPGHVAARVEAMLPSELSEVLHAFTEAYAGSRGMPNGHLRVSGRFETVDENRDFTSGSTHTGSEPSGDSGFRETDYFNTNVGFMPSEDLDFTKMVPVTVEQAPDDFNDEAIRRATAGANGTVERKEELGTRSTMIWHINYVYWSSAREKTRWYSDDPEAAEEAE
jgi:hypothetical protein